MTKENYESLTYEVLDEFLLDLAENKNLKKKSNMTNSEAIAQIVQNENKETENSEPNYVFEVKNNPSNMGPLTTMFIKYKDKPIMQIRWEDDKQIESYAGTFLKILSKTSLAELRSNPHVQSVKSHLR